MKYPQKKVPLHDLMLRLNITDTELSARSGVDRTLISRWRRGERRISPRSTQLHPLAEALLAMDADSLLDAYLAPWRQQGESNVDAMISHLTSSVAPMPHAEASRQAVPDGDEYTKQIRVYLGHKGFRKAALAMLDTVRQLPPGREVRVLCQGRYDWLVGDIAFVAQFIAMLRTSLRRNARLLVINRRGYSIAETAAFAGPWLLAHLHDYIRSRYYDGELPENLRFAASIPGYWSGRAEERDGVPESLYAQTQTDPYDIGQDELLIERYMTVSRPASQYRFLENPAGTGENACLWHEGPLPTWDGGEAPDGSFYALCRLPGFGIMTRAEWDEVRGRSPAPPLPEYLFAGDGFTGGPHRVILCREDIRDALSVQRHKHEALSVLLNRRAFVPHEMLTAQLRRLLLAMSTRDAFEVALVPRVAFEKLRLELVCWRGSVSVGWLQSMQNSVFADDRATSGSFHGFLGYVWDKLLAGWRNQEKVARQLRKWLAGQVQTELVDSGKVRNWDVMP